MGNPLHSFLGLTGVFEKVSNKIKTPKSRVKAKSSLPEKICRQFSLDQIRAATNNFDSNLVVARNYYGVVYKGFLGDDHGTIVVAVKFFLRGQSGHTELKVFRNEVQLLCQLRHQHLLPLIGFCDDRDQLILAYNYMSNNSLYERLHGSSVLDPLTWKQRLEICIGVARGLHYLHTGAKCAVIHPGINTQSILLDDQRVSKIGDFSLSKIGPLSMSKAPLRIELPSLSEEQISSAMGGTIGYLDPEFFINTNIVTDKLDVYSFGVVLIEVLCGRKVINFDAEDEDDRKHLIPWVSKCMRNGTIYQTIDPILKGKITPSCLEKYLEIALSCIKLEGNKRPDIGEVEATLELALELQIKADSKMEFINNPHGEVLNKKSPVQRKRSDLPEDICRQFSLAEIKAATNNFHKDSFIGEGGFGKVYRGTVDDGTMVAVKRSRGKHPGKVREFRQEVQLLSQLRHLHIVSLLGFCDEQNEMIIVYEYMSRRSLDASLFGDTDDIVPLGWKQRLQICIGVARGLHYLHTGAKYGVIHRDIKTSNILFDDEWSSKISDFGLSRMGPRSMSKPLVRINTRIMGTYGYMAPEYAMHGELTEKSDVFSFGVVLLEVLCGEKVAIMLRLLDDNGEFRTEGFIDPYLKGRIAPDCLKKYLEIASSCVKSNKNERPDMGEVEVTLELALDLQNKADSEMEGLNPYGEWMYDEQLSFSLSDFYN